MMEAFPSAPEGEDPQLYEDEVGEEEDEAEMDRKMQEAIALNEQLKSLVLEAEHYEQAQRTHAPAGRGRVSSASRRPGPPGPPGHAKNGGWGGTTHTAARSNQIAHENAILVSKLSSVALGSSAKRAGPAAPRKPVGPSSVSINRRQQDDKIARENAAMAKRLASVKPTASLAKQAHLKAAAQHKRHVANASRQAPAGVGFGASGSLRRPGGF